MAAAKFVGTHRAGRNGPYTGRALQTDPHTTVVFNTQFPLGQMVNVDHLTPSQHKKLAGNPTMAFDPKAKGLEAVLGPLPVERDDFEEYPMDQPIPEEVEAED